MTVIESRARITLSEEEKDILTKMISLVEDFQETCYEIGSCSNCPIEQECQSLNSPPNESIVNFCQALLNNNKKEN